jgi:nucleoid-associated protein YgaU
MFARAVVSSLLALLFTVSVLTHASDGAGGERTYVVRGGDSLWAIAVKHYAGDPRAAVWRLQERNGLRGATIRVGQTLVLP